VYHEDMSEAESELPLSGRRYSQDEWFAELTFRGENSPHSQDDASEDDSAVAGGGSPEEVTPLEAPSFMPRQIGSLALHVS